MDDMLRALAVPLLGLALPLAGLALRASSPSDAVRDAVGRCEQTSSQFTRAVTCIRTNRVTTAPTVTVSPVYPSKKNA